LYYLLWNIFLGKLGDASQEPKQHYVFVLAYILFFKRKGAGTD